MFGKMTGLAGLMGLCAVMIAGCSGDTAPAAADLERAAEVQNRPAIVAVEPSRTPTIAAPARSSAPEAAFALPTETAPVTADTPPPKLELPRPVNQLDEREYNWNQLLGRDAILPIYEPVFVSAQDAPYADDELVIGVELNGDARAYAIGPLNGREMVNDTVGGVPILVTW